ncbi:hypothetical protein RchiOBHm_Chr5g0063621 [Rosa chinensis]|uniref:Uncharacterized protein n=1 Tax=Rosa chinensis TaxID=74649 RepID=A0A2P6QIH1_ROSCH|nr:hypothetical protein RchiOBHm_Chr5g0063621 [Rosa chinensis]
MLVVVVYLSGNLILLIVSRTLRLLPEPKELLCDMLKVYQMKHDLTEGSCSVVPLDNKVLCSST